MTAGLSPKDPNKYVGPNVYLSTIVKRNRIPTGADFRQPETGKLYPVGSGWILGPNPVSGVEGDLWYLSKIVANVAYWVMLSTGAVGPIESFVVQSATAPGVNPVLPTAGGVVTINADLVAQHGVPIETHTRALNEYNVELQIADSAAASDIDLNGACHFNSSHFTIDADGFVSLFGGGGALDSIGVDGTSGTGTNPVLPTAMGLITVNGALVTAGTNPIRTISTAPNTYQIQLQTSQALAAADSTKVGAANFNSAHFSVDASGFVSSINAGPSVGVVNLGITYSGGTFTVRGANASLSATNVAYVTLQSKTAGNVVTIPVTANQTFIDDAGASTIVGNLFGLTTGVAATNDVPFFLYAVLNDAENAISFMISRYPNSPVSPASGSIGKTGSAVASTQGSFFALSNPTVTDYDSNPCLSIGSFRMTMSASDDWTVSALSASDGVGRFNEGTLFRLNAGQWGAASGKYFLDNGGTAPTFSTNGTLYFPGRDNYLQLTTVFSNCTGAGTGAVELLLALPFEVDGGSMGAGGWVDASSNVYVLNTSIVPSAPMNRGRIKAAGNGVSLTVLNSSITVSADVNVGHNFRAIINFT